mmetsp:Transcript_48430/g.126259  ORF Transcript_48430/g.126259 Transcript_48430/m.126259 type:complete len:85 (+) Transcript_48430:494-748(+)
MATQSKIRPYFEKWSRKNFVLVLRVRPPMNSFIGRAGAAEANDILRPDTKVVGAAVAISGGMLMLCGQVHRNSCEKSYKQGRVP